MTTVSQHIEAAERAFAEHDYSAMDVSRQSARLAWLRETAHKMTLTTTGYLTTPGEPYEMARIDNTIRDLERTVKALRAFSVQSERRQ